MLKFCEGAAAIQPDPCLCVWDRSLPPCVLLPGRGQEIRGTGTRYTSIEVSNFNFYQTHNPLEYKSWVSWHIKYKYLKLSVAMRVRNCLSNRWLYKCIKSGFHSAKWGGNAGFHSLTNFQCISLMRALFSSKCHWVWLMWISNSLNSYLQIIRCRKSIYLVCRNHEQNMKFLCRASFGVTELERNEIYCFNTCSVKISKCFNILNCTYFT